MTSIQNVIAIFFFREVLGVVILNNFEKPFMRFGVFYLQVIVFVKKENRKMSPVNYHLYYIYF